MSRYRKDVGQEKIYKGKSEESRRENPSYIKINTDLGVESILREEIDTEYCLRCLSTKEGTKLVRIHDSRLTWYEEFEIGDGRTCLRLKYGYEEMLETAKKEGQIEKKREEKPKRRERPSRTIGDFWGNSNNKR